MSTNRCKSCGVKVKLLDTWNCKCNVNDIFCTKHRYPFEHNCTYDFKKEHNKILESSNIKIQRKKVDII
jgi:hypothetical protein